MACEFCDQKGYLIISQLGHNKEYTQAKVCPHCQDVRAYSAYVQQKYSKSPQMISIPPDENNILDLEEFRKRKKS